MRIGLDCADSVMLTFAHSMTIHHFYDHKGYSFGYLLRQCKYGDASQSSVWSHATAVGVVEFSLVECSGATGWEDKLPQSICRDKRQSQCSLLGCTHTYTFRVITTMDRFDTPFG